VSATVTVAGGGPAACAAVVALLRRGLAVRLRARARSEPAPPVVLDEAAVALIVDLLGSGVLRGAHQLRRRVVSWGAAAPRSVARAALAVRGSELRARLLDAAFERLGGRLEPLDTGAIREEELTIATDPAWLPASTVERGGERVALCAEVALRRAADPAACYVEANAGGWLFLAPLADDRAYVQAVVPRRPDGDAAEALAALAGASRIVARVAARVDRPVEIFSAAPSLRRAPGAAGRLAAGGAALTLDPVCGDGTAQAMRGGLLAAATAAAIRDGLDDSAAGAHYAARLARSFAVHLAACAQTYDPAIFGPSWNDEIRAIRAAAAAHRAAPALTFGLEELRLVALAGAGLQDA
jgi:hypothetical protein